MYFKWEVTSECRRNMHHFILIIWAQNAETPKTCSIFVLQRPSLNCGLQEGMFWCRTLLWSYCRDAGRDVCTAGDRRWIAWNMGLNQDHFLFHFSIWYQHYRELFTTKNVNETNDFSGTKDCLEDWRLCSEGKTQLCHLVFPHAINSLTLETISYWFFSLN